MRESDDIQPSIEAKGALGRECLEHARERERENRGPEVVRCHCPRHAHLSVRKRQDLCRVCEKRNRFLAGRVEGVEEVDEKGD